MKHSTKLFIAAVAVLLLFVASTGWSYAQLWGTNYQFYPSQGYYNGSIDYFLMTDVSDAGYALTFKMMLGFNINFTPRLANALAPALRVFVDQVTHLPVVFEFMPSIYFVTNAPTTLVPPQLFIFSAEWPVPFPGTVPVPPPPTAPPYPRYAPQTYMPLWRLKLVTWNDPANATTLTSEAAVVSASGGGASQVTVTDAGVVVGASILINSLGNKVRQAQVVNYAGSKLVRLPIRPLYVNNLVYKMVQLDFSNPGSATVNKGTYSPWLNRFNDLKFIQPALPLASQVIYSFWPWPPLQQLYVGSDVPAPFGPANANANYSPLMNEWVVSTIGLPSPLPIFTSAAALAARPKYATGNMAFQPIIGQ